MYRTKVTKKGQITLPDEYRERLDIGAGTVLLIDIDKESIVVQKPKSSLKSMFGLWSDIDDKAIRKMKPVWRASDGKNIRRF